MPLSRALRRIACVAGLTGLCFGGAVRAADAPPPEDWIGAVSVDRFTDASWRIAAGRAQGDRGSLFELRLSCRRDGDRRDIAAEIFVFSADAKPLDIAWDYARDTGRERQQGCDRHAAQRRRDASRRSPRHVRSLGEGASCGPANKLRSGS